MTVGCGDPGTDPGSFPLPPAETQPFSSGIPMTEAEVLEQPIYWEIPNDPGSSRVGMWIPPIDEVQGIWIDYYNFDPSFKTARLQFASMHGYAVVLHNGGGFWDEAGDTKAEGQGTSERVAEMILDFVGEVQDHTGREELATAPLIVHGMSRYGSAGAVFANEFPQHQVVAATNIVAGPGKDSMFTDTVEQIPMLLMPGERDNSDTILDKFFDMQAAHEPRMAVAMNWGEGHKCGNCEQVAFPFLDQVLAARTAESGAIQDLDIAGGWLAAPDDWRTIAPYAEYPLGPSRAAWLPNRYTAQVWQAYVLEEAPLRFTSPTSAAKDKLRKAETSAADPITVTLRANGTYSEAIQLQDGDVLVDVEATQTTDGDGNTVFEFAGVQLLPGLHALIAVRDGAAVSRPGLVFLLP